MKRKTFDLKQNICKPSNNIFLKIKRIFLLTVTLVYLITLHAFCFSDVHKNDWFYTNVSDMTTNSYLTGYTDGTFRPHETITKAEFTVIVARIVNLSAATVSTSHWAASLVQSALTEGFFDWDEIPPTGETFDEPISRQLAIKIVMKAFLPDLKGEYDKVSSAPDFNNLDGRYYESVIAAVSNGIVLGDDTGKLNPKSNITRAEACAIIMRAANKKGNLTPYEHNESKNKTEPISGRSGGVSENGKLGVTGRNLCNEKGETVILHGMSSHGLQWFGNYVSESSIKALGDRGANLIRLAMYTAEGGYLTNKSVYDTLINAVDAAAKNDMYVIIDWHILYDNDPLQNVEEAEKFFSNVSKRYSDNPSVIYEICNEPNGNITWTGNVKPYAERVIKAIRKNSDGIIIVGSPTWSQDLHKVAENPIQGENIMYSCHFYAGTHTEWLRKRILDCNLPIFVTEWGTSAADGNGGVFLEESQKWIDFMWENNISWANWSLCDKNESSAALISGADISDGISDDELTQSGRFVFNYF